VRFILEVFSQKIEKQVYGLNKTPKQANGVFVAQTKRRNSREVVEAVEDFVERVT